MHAPLSRSKTDKPLRKKAIVRRTNAERSAAMRLKIIDAAIVCLARHGYAATSTTLVLAKAKTSRGAMLHHFPTKVDLMLAVARRAAEIYEEEHLPQIWAVADPRERFLAVTDITWQALQRPRALALLEIMVASRSDTALARRFPKLHAVVDQYLRDLVWDIAKSAGVTDRTRVDAMVRLHLAAMRGLSIDRVLAPGDRTIDEAFQLLKHYKRLLADELTGGK